MIIDNSKMEISILRDDSFILNSADNKKHYDIVFNPKEYSQYYNIFSVSIVGEKIKKEIALVGNILGLPEDVALFTNNKLIVLVNNYIAVIDCVNFGIESYNDSKWNGCFFSIHNFCGGYIIYGEAEIIKFSQEFETEWSFSGADIFATCNDDIPFIINDEVIHLTDWLGNKYHLDKFGKLIAPTN